MKYGQTLQQRSIPAWGPYNVDYNDIKHLIKTRTTGDRSPAIDVPGREDGIGVGIAPFEDELFGELLEQFERVQLFVRSKAGEIERRLEHQHRSIVRLAQKDFPAGRKRLPIARLEKWSKAEEDVLKAGEDVQALARFAGAQRLAFKKLLKKYTKWTESSSLDKRFLQDVVEHPDHRATWHFEHLLNRWVEVLRAVRALFEDGTRATSKVTPNGSLSLSSRDAMPNGSSSSKDSKESGRKLDTERMVCARIHHAGESGSDVDFDTAFSLSPMSERSSRATYWVHTDNLIQAQVLILQFTRLCRRVASPDHQSSSGSCSRRNSLSTLSREASAPSEGISYSEATTVVYDNIDRFAKQQSGITINDLERGAGQTLENAVLSARFVGDSDAIVAFKGSLGNSSKSVQDPYSIRRVKRKHLDLLPEDPSSICGDFESSQDPCVDTTLGFPEATRREARRWASENKNVQPLVEICSNRSRFAGLDNTTRQGVWITLDKEITLQKPGSLCGQALAFPHAVLEIRSEGEVGCELLRALDKGHLTERVRGFSLETHGVAGLWQPKQMQPPFWSSALEKDIRKVPNNSLSPIRRNGTLQHSESANSKTSASATSMNDFAGSSTSAGAVKDSSATSLADQLISPARSPLKKQWRSRSKISLDQSSRQQNHAKYWNEYDDGEERPDNDPYTVLIDPNASMWFPGQKKLAAFSYKFADQWKSHFGKASEDQSLSTNPEQRPLMGRFCSLSHAQDNGDFTSTTDEEAQFPHYSTFPHYPSSISSNSSESALRAFSASSFAVSIVLLILQAVFLGLSVSSAHTWLQLGVVVCAFASIGFAVLGLGLLLCLLFFTPTALTNVERPSWAVRILGILTFGLVCVGSATILAIVGSDV